MGGRVDTTHQLATVEQQHTPSIETKMPPTFFFFT
jgi:hypothetical protein